MKLRNLFIFHAVIALFFGASLVLAPAPLMSLHGATLNQAGVSVARAFGVELLGYAALTWFARNAEESEARQAIVLALFLAQSIHFIVLLVSMLSGLYNALGWFSVALYLLLALGYGYFQFVKPSAS